MKKKQMNIFHPIRFTDTITNLLPNMYDMFLIWWRIWINCRNMYHSLSLFSWNVTYWIRHKCEMWLELIWVTTVAWRLPRVGQNLHTVLMHMISTCVLLRFSSSSFLTLLCCDMLNNDNVVVFLLFFVCVMKFSVCFRFLILNIMLVFFNSLL